MDQTTNEILFGGGAGGGKTTLALAWLIMQAFQYPGSRWMIGRKELKRLKQSVLPALFDLFRQYGFRKNRDYIYNSSAGEIIFLRTKKSNEDNDACSKFIFMDLSHQPNDPQYERLGSLEFTGGFIEEAAEVEQKAKEVVFSRIRYRLDDFGLIPKLLMTCNPSKNWLYGEFYKPSREGSLPEYKAFIQALVTDNPHISMHYIESLKRLKDRILRERLLNGNWEYEDSDLAIFVYDKIIDMFTNTLIQENAKQYVSVDAARFGNDKAVITRWLGLQAVEFWEYAKSATTLIEDKIRDVCATYSIPISQVIVDEEGVGGGIVDHLKCKGFVGGSSAIDRRKDFEKEFKTEYKLNYKNLRAQCYHKFSELCNEAKIAITIDNEEFKQMVIEEAEQIRRINADSDNKFQIIPKDEIKLAIGRSPDYLDTLMMRMWFEVNPERAKARGYNVSASEAGF